jgi:AraC family transcriptional regulator
LSRSAVNRRVASSNLARGSQLLLLPHIRNRSAWDDTFVDALCEPAETFTFGGVFAHIMTFNAHRQLMALDALRQLSVQTEGFGDPMEYEESVAPWNQQVPLKTP